MVNHVKLSSRKNKVYSILIQLIVKQLFFLDKSKKSFEKKKNVGIEGTC